MRTLSVQLYLNIEQTSLYIDIQTTRHIQGEKKIKPKKGCKYSLFFTFDTFFSVAIYRQLDNLFVQYDNYNMI